MPAAEQVAVQLLLQSAPEAEADDDTAEAIGDAPGAPEA
jgi:hypothetical protein